MTLVVSTFTNGNDRVRKEKRQGRKKSPSPLNYAPTGPFRTIFIFFKLLNFAVDPENHTETYSGLSYKPAGNLTTLSTTVRSLPPRTFLNRHQV